MPEGHDTIIEVSNIMSFVLYTQILKQSVLKPASPGITLRDPDMLTMDFWKIGFFIGNDDKCRDLSLQYFKAAVSQIFTELWLKILFHQQF